MHAGVGGKRRRPLSIDRARAPPLDPAFSGRVVAFTYDERGHCDGVLLEIRCKYQGGLESREPEIEAAITSALSPRIPITFLANPTAPVRPLPMPPEDG